uniref:Uncharacterized protein n=1 Tax=Panagrolaimus sp. ES5 TaxID=591445 RepID=A0AC34GJ12_9BILA
RKNEKLQKKEAKTNGGAATSSQTPVTPIATPKAFKAKSEEKEEEKEEEEEPEIPPELLNNK